eukprot:GFUD01000404.1.p1 GENE.GFUD01000404.1~~GFUD01000404.1.p1  ORF type:complete len:160 (+),score=47.66 GFUD01000404.1:369-848(+)
MPTPRTITEAGAGATAYQQHRGPQYYLDRTHMAKGMTAYNCPAALYSEESLAKEADSSSYIQATQSHVPTLREPSLPRGQESETLKMVMEAEMAAGKSVNQDKVDGKHFAGSSLDRPDSQLSNTSDRWPTVDPVRKNSSINQSTSFKKLMYSVMGDSEV